MFDNFTFAACARAEDGPQCASASLSPHDTSYLGPSSPSSLPASNTSAGPSMQSCPTAESMAGSHIAAEQPSQSLSLSSSKPTAITDITSQLSTQSIAFCKPDFVVSPTYPSSYDHQCAYGLPSPASSSRPFSCSNAFSPVLESHEDLDINMFPVVDDDPDAVAPPIALPRLRYRSTWNMYAPGSPAASDSFHTRRVRRQCGTRLLCDNQLERLVEDLEGSSSTSDRICVTRVVNSPVPTPTLSSSVTAPASQDAQGQVVEGERAPHPDEGFFDCPSPTTSSADDEELLRAYTMRRAAGPSGISKWRDMGMSIRSGGFFRPGDSLGATKVLNRPRMRKSIGRRKRDVVREVDAGGGPPAANGVV